MNSAHSIGPSSFVNRSYTGLLARASPTTIAPAIGSQKIHQAIRGDTPHSSADLFNSFIRRFMEVPFFYVVLDQDASPHSSRVLPRVSVGLVAQRRELRRVVAPGCKLRVDCVVAGRAGVPRVSPHHQIASGLPKTAT